MTPEEMAALPSRAPDRRIPYGRDASQYGELRIPAGTGSHPLVVLIHGGCFKAEYATAQYFGAMADALKADGIATWNIEYRRLGQAGGGWPGSYLDVGRAVDHVRAIAAFPATSEVYSADPLPLRGVVDLAGPVDLTANIQGYEALCRDTVITSLLGGTPATVPDRYAQASAIRLLPLAIPQVLIVGSHEDYVPLPLVDAYVQAATQAGDQVRRILIPGAGHFELASPLAFTWPQVKAAIESLFLDGTR
jgi:acetyl esterase/lipase